MADRSEKMLVSGDRKRWCHWQNRGLVFSQDGVNFRNGHFCIMLRESRWTGRFTRLAADWDGHGG